MTVLFCFMLTGFATVNAVDFRNLDSNSGLSQNTVWAITQDDTGFLWLGTSLGLNRFDGRGFDHYISEQGPPLGPSNPIVRDVLYDRRGRLWLATASGLNLMEKEHGFFREIPLVRPGNTASFVLALAQSSSGMIWAGSDFLQTIDPNTLEAELFEKDGKPFEPDAIRKIIAHGENVWLATDSGLWFVEYETGNTRNWTVENSALRADTVRSLCFDKADKLWIGTTAGLHLMSLETGVIEQIVLPELVRPNEQFNVLELGPDGHVWAGTLRSGLWRFDGDTHQWQGYQRLKGKENELASQDITALFFDRSRMVWAGTYTDGVSVMPLDPPNVSGIQLDADGPLRHVKDLCEDADGIFWIGTNNGLIRYNPDNGQAKRWRRAADSVILEDQLNDIAVWNNKIWCGTYSGGVNVFDPKTETFERVDIHNPTGNLDNSVFRLFNSGDYLWAGSFRGIERYNPETGDFRNIYLEEFPIFRVMDFYGDRDGHLWVGTESKGLLRLHMETLEVKHYHSSADASVPSYAERVDTIVEDSAGRLWLGSIWGLARMEDSGQFRYFDNRVDLPGASVFAIVPDDNDGIWISTDSGIVHARISESGSLDTRSLGVPKRMSFSRGASLRSGDRYYFGGSEGVVFFDPETLTTNNYRPCVALTSLKIFDRDVPISAISESNPLVLEPINNLVLEFAALDFKEPERNLYAYKLEGVDGDWRQAGNRNWLSYNNLPPGEYLFRVKGSNNDGLWSNREATLHLQVRKPWWQTLWFMGGSLFLIICVIITAHRLRVNMLAERNRFLEVLVADQTSELETTRQDLLNIARRSAIYEITYSVLKQIDDQTDNVKDLLQSMKSQLSKVEPAQLDTAADRLQQHLSEQITDGAEEDIARELYALEDSFRESRTHLERDTVSLTASITHMRETITVQHGYAREGEEQIDICALIDDALQLEKRLTTNSDIRIRKDYRSRPYCSLPRIKLLSVLTQVIHNALEAMSLEPVKILGVRVEDEENNVYIKIADTGRGIPEDLQEKIFDDGFTTKSGHHGLGLYSCSRAMKELNGKLELGAGAGGRGTVVTMILPKISPGKPS